MGLIVVARDGTEDNGEDDDEDDEIMGTAGSTGRLLEVLADEIGEVGTFAGSEIDGGGIIRPNEVDLDADDGPEDASGATVG